MEDFLSGQAIGDEVYLEYDYQMMLDSITTLNVAVTELTDSIASLNGITLDETSSEDSFPTDAEAFFSGEIPIGSLGDDGFFIGSKFDVELDIVVHGLGVFHPYGVGFELNGDETADFFTGNQLEAEVRLYSETGELLASAVVDPGPGLCDYSADNHPTASEYSYEAISEVTLSANSTYYLIMKTGPGVFYMYDEDSPEFGFDSNVFSNVSTRNADSNGADFDSYNPATADDNQWSDFYFSCNMLYTPFTCGTSTVTFDGHDYSTVEMGSQCWFAENLRSENYANGDEIPGNLEDATWTSTTSGAQAIHNNSDTNLEAYGRLYNWYAVEDSRGLCPTGWHVPTNDEWTALTTHLGGESVAGDKMKSSATNSPSWDGSNSSGFSGLPGGRRSWSDGSFSGEGNSGFWWSTSPYGTLNIFIRRLSSGLDGAIREHNVFRSGYSVRCLKD